MKRTHLLFLACVTLSLHAFAAEPIKALIIDGQNNHDWKATTPILKSLLQETGLFTVQVATTPPHGTDMSDFRPQFADYQVIVMNYNGDSWPQATQDDFVKFVHDGGGLVVVHAADNSFPDWKEYNEMIGLGGWGGRNEKSGHYLRLVDGQFVRDDSPGIGGSHGQQHAFLIVVRQPGHPIVAGLPEKWLHAPDELYDRLRGPADNLEVLATAYSEKAKGGSGHDEPMLMTITYGKGRVFHTTLGHGVPQLRCVGFITTFQRGAEWVVTGKVAQKVPDDFPTADHTSVRAP